MMGKIKIAVTHGVRAKIAYEIALGLSKMRSSALSEVTVSYAFGGREFGGFLGPKLLDEGEIDIAFANPSSITYTACNGLDPFTRRIAIKNLAVFPSWDRLGFAVKRQLGVRSLREIGEKKPPLTISTRSQGPGGATVFSVEKVLQLHGWSLAEAENWGGKVYRVGVPGDPTRLEGLRQGSYDAVFDEGIVDWADLALSDNMIFLPLEKHVFREMELLGYRTTFIPKAKFAQLNEDIPSLEFGGWALYCKADLLDDVAYLIVKAIDQRRETIPVDAEKLEMGAICKNTENGPLCIPLHPGAEQYYRERGYL